MSGSAPARSAVDPAAFADLMPQAFILGRAFTGVYPVRLAGGFVNDLHGRDLRRANGLSLWAERDRSRLQSALEEIRRRPDPLIAAADAIYDHGRLGIEILFAPLVGPDGDVDRFLGLYQPLGMTARLQGEAVTALALRSLTRAGAANEEIPRLRLATLHGRSVA